MTELHFPQLIQQFMGKNSAFPKNFQILFTATPHSEIPDTASIDRFSNKIPARFPQTYTHPVENQFSTYRIKCTSLSTNYTHVNR